jgi:hypothetical protein
VTLPAATPPGTVTITTTNAPGAIRAGVTGGQQAAVPPQGQTQRPGAIGQPLSLQGAAVPAPRPDSAPRAAATTGGRDARSARNARPAATRGARQSSQPARTRPRS